MYVNVGKRIQRKPYVALIKKKHTVLLIYTIEVTKSNWIWQMRGGLTDRVCGSLKWVGGGLIRTLFLRLSPKVSPPGLCKYKVCKHLTINYISSSLLINIYCLDPPSVYTMEYIIAVKLINTRVVYYCFPPKKFLFLIGLNGTVAVISS